MNKSLKQKIQDRIILHNTSLLSALKQMDRIEKKLLFVFDDNKFVNIVSIGDIQRAVIKNFDLNTAVNEVLREDTTIAFVSESFEIVKERIWEERIECMPVLNKDRELVDVYFWEEIFPAEQKRVERSLNLPVVIMAGGKGSRLKPITNVLPKPLLPLDDKTVLEHIMDRFVNIGCFHFHFSVNYKSDMIRHYFSNLNNSNYDISYFTENKPLGTAGSLSLLKGKINETFFVSNCDIIIEEDYGEIYDYHKQNNNELTLVSALKHYPIPYGTVDTGENGVLKKLTEKPDLTFQINSGMYILEPHLLNEIPDDKFFNITSLIDLILKRGGKVGVFPVSEGSWKDFGNWDEYLAEIRSHE